MAAFGALVEVLVLAAVKVVQSIEDVLASVRVYNVQEDSDAKAMGSVDKLLEFLGGTCKRLRESLLLISSSRVDKNV